MPKASFLAEANEIQPPHTALLTVRTGPVFAVNIPPNEIELDPVTAVRTGDESKESIAEFAARLAVEGLAQPILVRPRANGTGGYRVIAGRRRLLAMQSLGLTIPAYVRDVDDETARRLAFEENYRRKQFTPIDLAKLFIEARGDKPPANWSERVSRQFGVSRATVTEHVKMYEGIMDDPKLIAHVHSGALALDAAILLAKMRGDARAAQLASAKLLAQEEEDRKAAAARTSKKYDASKKAAARAGKSGKASKSSGKPLDTLETTSETATGLESGKSEPPTPEPEPEKPRKPAKVKAKHLVAAQRAQSAQSGDLPHGRAMTRSEILEDLCSLIDPGYPKAMNAFLAFLYSDYQSGKGGRDGLVTRWRMIASEIPEAGPNATATAKPPARKPGKKTAVKTVKNLLHGTKKKVTKKTKKK
jgi:ParB/RepB/Spo0J family partition protein